MIEELAKKRYEENSGKKWGDILEISAKTFMLEKAAKDISELLPIIRAKIARVENPHTDYEESDMWIGYEKFRYDALALFDTDKEVK